MGKLSYRRPDFGSAELWLAALLLCIGMVTEASACQVILVLSERNTPYLEFAVYSTAAQIGRPIAGIIRRRPFVLPPQAPRYFNVRVNRNVVRVLSPNIPSGAQLLSALRMESPL
ncbi:MAG: hypothetical protein ACYCZJ_09140 [Sulfuriferula sp.]